MAEEKKKSQKFDPDLWRAHWYAGPHYMAKYLTRNRADKFLIPRHVEFMGKRLAGIADEEGHANRRFIIQVSVRHGKSILGSKWLPAWFLSLFPHMNVIHATYEADFAAHWGREVKNILNEHSKKFNLRVAQDSAAAKSWRLDYVENGGEAGTYRRGGGMHTCGVGGPITGRGANLFIVDDPIKNAEEAQSEVYREKMWQWWNQTARTRIEPGGSIVFIMARWHEDDLAGRLIEHASKTPEADQWDVISLPAIAEEDDQMGRKPGEPLWPERYTIQALNQIKAGEPTGYTWSALYQQRPSPVEGGLFKKK
jgi:hypothetical protein